MGTSSNNTAQLFYRLLPAQIFLVIASGLSGIINGLIIGNLLSNTAMAALGLTTPLSNLLGSLATIVSGGAGILCGKYMGRGQVEKVSQAFSNAMIVLTACGAALTVFCLTFAVPLAHLLKAGPETLAETAAYIRGTAVGILPMLLIPCLMVFLQMCNKPGISLAGTVVLTVSNTVFCLLGIRVLHGGVFAAALAASLSRFAAAAFLIGYLMWKKDLVRFDRSGFQMKMSGEMLALGSPGSLAGIMYSVRNMFINGYASGIGGVTAVNALAILGACGCFFDCFNVGVGNSLGMLASVAVGEKDTRSLKDAMRIAVLTGFALCFVRLVVVYLFGGGIAVLFGAKGDVVDATRSLLILYSWCAPFNILTVVMMGAYQSLGRVRFCNMLYPVNCLIVPFLCCAFLTRVMGITAIWSCYMISEIVTLSLMYLIASARNKAPAHSVEDLLHMGDEMEKGAKFSITIKEEAEVVNVSQRVQSFCEEQGIDGRRSMLAGLCMEEMAGNIVSHGFTKDKKKHSIDAFVCVEDDQVLLRLRDNCVPFDPGARLKMHDPEQPYRNVGIKLVSGIAKEMRYQAMFGMNVLHILL